MYSTNGLYCRIFYRRTHFPTFPFLVPFASDDRCPVFLVRSMWLTFRYIVWLSVAILIVELEAKSESFVTFGSNIKLLNVAYKVRLHSHDVKYGTGSGQQSVTGTQQQDDVNSHWIVKGPSNKVVNRGDPVKCGDLIRLEHLSTGKNLHSHLFSSPLSKNQEISAYGNDGVGDSGDHWSVVCDNEFWERSSKVLLQHQDTDVYLSVSGQTYGRPINGQMEVVGTNSVSTSHWKAAEGLFIHKNEFDPKQMASDHHMHTEL